MSSCRRFPSLVIVDASVIDYQSLINSISSEANVLILDREQDGIEQITQTLATVEAVESIHIVSHGSPGMLQLGAAHLSWQTLDRYASHLQAWAKTLKKDAEILLYGCEVAAGTVGRWFVQQLKSLTGAEVAASTNRTGSAAFGGDWTLEYATSTIQTPLVFSATAMAAYPHVLTILTTDTFRDSDVADKNWLFGVGASVPGSPAPLQPFLTARNTDVAPTGGLPGNPNIQLDTPGEGALRLTDNQADQSAFVVYNRAIDARQGLTITFELFAYGGTTNPLRADGISFFLLNGSASPTQAGAFGGSLGYAQKNNTPTAGPVAGIQGGFVGIGFDEYGNFSSATDSTGGETVRTGGAAQRIPDSIGVRAGQQTTYQFVEGSGTLPFGIDVPTATTREGATRTVKVDLTPAGLLTVQIDGNNDGDFLEQGERSTQLTNINISAINNAATPSTLKFGFAAGTGDYNNIHEVRNLVVSTLNNDPTAVDFSATVRPGSTIPLPGFSASDPDVADGDRIDSYSILTLPPASQGVLYLGNPANGGTPITTLPAGGLALTPAQIQTIYFQSTTGFTNTTFTYTATDTRGSSDPTPATVTISPGPNNGSPPNTDPSSFGIELNSVKRVPGLGGSDPDGTVTSFTILTLPPNNLGTLYLGDPRQGGTPITAGQTLTPQQIQQVYFRSSGTRENTGFTYRATDNSGLSDPTPARVEIGIAEPVTPGCLRGKNIKGSNGNNKLTGTPNIDRIRGLNGNDTIKGRDCPDVLDGGGGNDKLAGGAARDRLRGRQGKDVARGNAGDDVLDLGLRNDKGYGGKGNDVGYGRRGNDRLEGRAGDDTMFGGRGKDQLFGASNSDTLDGQQGDDLVVGGRGRDVGNGGLGKDKLRGGQKADIIYARRGNDVAWGGPGVDVVLGQRGNDRLSGNTQPDRLNGGYGDDIITGGGGSDRIRTGIGADRIRYKSALQGVDLITDFDVAKDVIDLRDIFKKSQYTSTDPFSDYVRLGNSARGAVLRVDADGGVSGNFVRLAILRDVQAASLTPTTNFLV